MKLVTILSLVLMIVKVKCHDKTPRICVLGIGSLGITCVDGSDGDGSDGDDSDNNGSDNGGSDNDRNDVNGSNLNSIVCAKGTVRLGNKCVEASGLQNWAKKNNGIIFKLCPSPLISGPGGVCINPKAMKSKVMNPKAMNLMVMNPKALNLKAMNPKAMNPKAINPKAMNPKTMNLKAINPKAILNIIALTSPVLLRAPKPLTAAQIGHLYEKQAMWRLQQDKKALRNPKISVVLS